MISPPILLAAEDTAATDLLARALAITGVALAALSLLLALHRERRDRARVQVELSTTTEGGAGRVNYLNALVKVRNRGRRPTTVEEIDFKRADRKRTSSLDIRPIRIPGVVDADEGLRAFGINTQPPPAPLGEGEILIWSFRLQETDEPWTGSWPPPPTTPFRAVIKTTKRKPIRSNTVGFWLRPWLPADPSTLGDEM